ncbi:hypothetical protein F4810DRAFT_670483 [Camillea tinctor]|nr:hypothetical protein F4810DRAFT_670483 [Camillea tinctor]
MDHHHTRSRRHSKSGINIYRPTLNIRNETVEVNNCLSHTPKVKTTKATADISPKKCYVPDAPDVLNGTRGRKPGIIYRPSRQESKSKTRYVPEAPDVLDGERGRKPGILHNPCRQKSGSRTRHDRAVSNDREKDDCERPRSVEPRRGPLDPLPGIKVEYPEHLYTEEVLTDWAVRQGSDANKLRASIKEALELPDDPPIGVSWEIKPVYFKVTDPEHGTGRWEILNTAEHQLPRILAPVLRILLPVQDLSAWGASELDCVVAGFKVSEEHGTPPDSSRLLECWEVWLQRQGRRLGKGLRGFDRVFLPWGMKQEGEKGDSYISQRVAGVESVVELEPWSRRLLWDERRYVERCCEVAREEEKKKERELSIEEPPRRRSQTMPGWYRDLCPRCREMEEKKKEREKEEKKEREKEEKKERELSIEQPPRRRRQITPSWYKDLCLRCREMEERRHPGQSRTFVEQYWSSYLGVDGQGESRGHTRKQSRLKYRPDRRLGFGHHR